MNKVFFGGSRKLGKLSKEIRERADNLIEKGYMVLVGDANGADKAMQQYLAERLYQHVLVFCAGNVCRNNLGEWKTHNVLADRLNRDFEYYALRDKKMSEEADYGFMLWDGESKGTLNNIVSLLERNKSALVYFSPTKEFFTLKTGRDLEKLLLQCDPAIITRLDRVLKRKKRMNPEQSQIKFA